MSRWRGRRSSRRKTLRRNLAKRRELAAAHASGTGSVGSGAGTLTPEPDDPKATIRVGVRKRRPALLGDWDNLADDLLRGALRVSGLTRGVLALQVPTEKLGRFRVERQSGFGRHDRGRLQTVLGVLGDTLRTRKQRAAHGGQLRRAQLGAVMAIPLTVNGTLLGALVLEDADRRAPPPLADLSRVAEFAQHLANVLAHRLNDLRRPQDR